VACGYFRGLWSAPSEIGVFSVKFLARLILVSPLPIRLWADWFFPVHFQFRGIYLTYWYHVDKHKRKLNKIHSVFFFCSLFHSHSVIVTIIVLYIHNVYYIIRFWFGFMDEYFFFWVSVYSNFVRSTDDDDDDHDHDDGAFGVYI
jgi:hypothetical protein